MPIPTLTSSSQATSVTSASSATDCSRLCFAPATAARTCCWATLAAPTCRASIWHTWPVTTSRRRWCSKTSKRSEPRSGRCAPTSGDGTGSTGTAPAARVSGTRGQLRRPDDAGARRPANEANHDLDAARRLAATERVVPEQHLPREYLAHVASYDVPTTLVLEDQQTKRTTIWTLRAD